jgi:medium-chain acyl-[acyl-carrier-protein] hydrolase
MNFGTSSPWLTWFKPNPAASMRLFCFPYAGAGASVYRAWASALPREIEVCGIQYPGRENRAGEPCVKNLSGLLDALVPAILPALDRPFAFFGHSMGALVTFELTRALMAKGCVRPEHVFFSGAGAPHTPLPKQIHHLRDTDFLREVIRLNGIPKDALRSPDLIRYLLPILRADFSLCEQYRYQTGLSLDCPVTVFGGQSDPRVDTERLLAWSDHASGYFSSGVFAGDHFFIRTSQAAILQALLIEIQPLIDAATAA